MEPGNVIRCTCQEGFIESPNTLEGCVETKNPCDPNPCGHGAVCDTTRNPPCYCPGGLYGNPYTNCTAPGLQLCRPGPCGPNADCYIQNSREICKCKYGFDGSPYEACHPVVDPCVPSPCGPNTDCRNHNGRAVCTCKRGYKGHPISYQGCQPDCVKNEDCPDSKACVNYQCVDPCPSACGIDAECRPQNHRPVCYCPYGLEGNPYVRCIPRKPEPQKKDPCHPTPCGANAHCKVYGGRPVCSCIQGYHGDPLIGCKPECVTSVDCPQNRECRNLKCVDPCPEMCGINAYCTATNHRAVCQCKKYHIGDPYTECLKATYPPPPPPTAVEPCEPNPCGPNSYCRTRNGAAICSCHPGYFGKPCRPECMSDSECPSNKACISFKCSDPCNGVCGLNAICTVVQHRPVCSCPPSRVGDPFVSCERRPVTKPPPPQPISRPCNPYPCGDNTICEEKGNVALCKCKPNYFGNPGLGCRPECVLNSDCPSNRACVDYHCKDPCPGTCGVNAECRTHNHVPTCKCLQGYEGNPFSVCTKYVPPPPEPSDPCQPNPCGPYSECRTLYNRALCSCNPGYIGSSPNCRPECTVDSDCAIDKACRQQKCVDPCPGACGQNARCSVRYHSAVCTCLPGFRGNPTTFCSRIPDDPPPAPRDPCVPSPCGNNAECKNQGNRAVCSCLQGFFGSPPYCKPECTVSAECAFSRACIKYKCQDPCHPSPCGIDATCQVIDHIPVCSCPKPGYEGDPLLRCHKVVPQPVKVDPCSAINCGLNAQCRVIHDRAVCECIYPYEGDPYSACKTECQRHADCPSNKACSNYRCIDPCNSLCGINAVCTVYNHIPACSCAEGYTGDPFRHCNSKPKNTCKDINYLNYIY